ncbi:hypothetical protein [Poriferisphaera sp. WC338]|uniref:hypothetical protein n=1 Tax=Poriferisphaera sp. WC338 TaxID=3425129 RepID=UPI003D81834C
MIRKQINIKLPSPKWTKRTQVANPNLTLVPMILALLLLLFAKASGSALADHMTMMIDQITEYTQSPTTSHNQYAIETQPNRDNTFRNPQ